MVLKLVVKISFRTALSAPHVLWLDNFSKFYTTRLPKATSGPFRQCLWSVSAIRPVDIDLSVVYNEDDEIYPAMPPDLYANMDELLELLKKSDGVSPLLYDSSVWNFDLFTIPPGPPAKKDQTDLTKEFWDDVPSPGLKTYIPRGIRPDNVGSNHEMLACIEDWMDEKNSTVTGLTNYGILLSDINIYDRLLKVIFPFVLQLL